MKKSKLKTKYKIIGLLLLFVIGFGSAFFLFKARTFEDKKPSPVTKEDVSSPPLEEPKREEYHLTLGMIGDALYHTGTYKDGLKSDGTYNYDHQLDDIRPLVKDYDLAYYNQETVLGGKELGLSSYPCFNSPQEVGDAFVKAGFNLVSLANNHTLDKGTKAILNSVAYWRNQTSVMTAGSYDSESDRSRVHIGEKNGITYAFLAYTYGTNGIPVPKGKEYVVNLFSKEQAKKDIEAVRDKVDVVLVAMHWGVEYTHTPTKEQRDWAQFLSGLGVDVIIGSHPHVIQPIEFIDDTLVIYSLGNFISGQEDLMKKIGLIASVDIHKVVEDGKSTITLDQVKGDLLYTYHRGHKGYRVIPFYKLTNKELLDDVTKVKTQYESILNKTNHPKIKIGTLGLAS
ncbi:MAG: CapA family protein [Bacilli bacterium]|jgi:poly-gamma-glutamate synthesis protein (capsule biosynthesis protein)|nr:CapA family protein [Bacilli bacterium]